MQDEDTTDLDAAAARHSSLSKKLAQLTVPAYPYGLGLKVCHVISGLHSRACPALPGHALLTLCGAEMAAVICAGLQTRSPSVSLLLFGPGACVEQWL